MAAYPCNRDLHVHLYCIMGTLNWVIKPVLPKQGFWTISCESDWSEWQSAYGIVSIYSTYVRIFKLSADHSSFYTILSAQSSQQGTHWVIETMLAWSSDRHAMPLSQMVRDHYQLAVQCLVYQMGHHSLRQVFLRQMWWAWKES